MGVGTRLERGEKAVRLPPLPRHCQRFHLEFVSHPNLLKKVMRQAAPDESVPLSHHLDLLLSPILCMLQQQLTATTMTTRNVTNRSHFFLHLPHSRRSQTMEE